jgi:hypothetical protein
MIPKHNRLRIARMDPPRGPNAPKDKDGNPLQEKLVVIEADGQPCTANRAFARETLSGQLKYTCTHIIDALRITFRGVSVTVPIIQNVLDPNDESI